MIAFTDLQSRYACYLSFKFKSFSIKKFNLEIGIGLSGFGIFFLTLGMLLLFDKGLLAIGNVIINLY